MYSLFLQTDNVEPKTLGKPTGTTTCNLGIRAASPYASSGFANLR